MGVGLYLKPVSKDGRSLLYLRAKKGNKTFIKSILLKVKPSDWLPRNSQVKGTSPNSIIINRRLTEITNNMNLAWSDFEAGIIGWDSLCVKLGGDRISSTGSLSGFLKDVIEPKCVKDSTYTSYVGCTLALLKAIGKNDIQLKELTNQLIDECVIKWKSRNLSSSSIRTYITHIGRVKREAYKKGLISENFERDESWRVSRGKKGSTKIIQTCKSEDFENAIPKIKDIYDLQAMMFYLLMFSLRGLYQADLVTMYKHEHKAGDKLYIKHYRSKTNELMEINLTPILIRELILLIHTTIKITHGNKVNKRTGEKFKKGEDVYIGKGEKGSFFKYDINDSKTHKNVWDVYQKRIKKLIGMPFKTARKTFESYALKLRISQDIRYKLLGHTDQSIKAHYQDWEWDELKEQVDEAHQEVLKEYRVEYLYDLLIKKGKDLGF
jgi:hypothetical protein